MNVHVTEGMPEGVNATIDKRGVDLLAREEDPKMRGESKIGTGTND